MKKVSASQKCVLVDGSSYLFRAYHALPPLTNSQGKQTGAIYGMINMLRKLMKDENPHLMAVVFDTKSKNFRHALFPAYKANRPEMPDELSQQIAPLHDIIKALGIPLLALEGFEADDVIATLAHQAKAHDIDILISTGDKDLAQLVNDKVTLVNTMTGKVLDREGVKAKFDVYPEQIVDYLALMGDSVDNIPGVAKVGPKTAAKWLNTYQTLDNLIENAQEIKGKVGENLREAIKDLPLLKKLVTVQCDLELPVQVESLTLKGHDEPTLIKWFENLEFKTWLKDLKKAETAVLPVRHYETVIEEERLLEWVQKIKAAKWVAVDSETTSLNALTASLVGISFSVEVGKAIYIPLGHTNQADVKQLPLDKVLSVLKPLLEDPVIKKIGQHLKYDMHVFARYNITLQGIAGDTMLASYVLNSTVTRHDMDSLAQFYLKTETIPYEAVAGKGAKQISFDKVTIEKATEYAAEDADITLKLHQVLSEKLKEIPSLQKVYETIEVPLIEVLWRMEEYGIALDVQKLQKQSEELAEKLKTLEEEAIRLAGKPFNVSSPKQLQEILYQDLKLPILEKTPTGAPSTAESVLQELSHDYELPRVILQYRTLSKLKSTYTDKLPLQINEKTHRVHTSYHQAVTATGRLSSTDPNLQNIPVRTEEGRKIRQAFIPEKGNLLLSADYSQIELRIMAHLSKDPGLLKAFQAGEDIHRFTASEIFGIPLEEVTSLQRRSAKAINFGLIYGMSSFGLARQLDIERQAAQAYMDAYFHRYPNVKGFMEATREKAAKEGYVETLFGRRLYLPDLKSKNFARRRQAERAAINGPMQGTGADIIKRAMITLHEALKNQQDIKMLMQVHDELLFEITPAVEAKAKNLIKQCMEGAADLLVPLVVDIGVGKNWDEAH